MKIITAKELKTKYGIHRPWLYYMAKAGVLVVDRRIENGKTKNYYNLDEVLKLRGSEAVAKESTNGGQNGN